MTRRFLSFHLRHLLSHSTPPNPKPISFPTTQKGPFSQSCFLPWELKLNRGIYFSSYKASELLFSATSRYIMQMGRLLTREAWLRCFSLQRRGGVKQKPISRSRLSRILTPDSMVFLLLGANVAVYILWKNADPSFMKKHFTISLDNIKSGQFHTLITCAFSNRLLIHLLINMLGFESFARTIAHMFGPKFLLKLYLGGAFTGSIFFLVNHAFLDPSRGKGGQDVFGLGSSAAVNTMILFCAVVLPKQLVYHVIPMPNIMLGIIWIACDLGGVYMGYGNVSAAQLGGALVGILVGVRIRKKF